MGRSRLRWQQAPREVLATPEVGRGCGVIVLISFGPPGPFLDAILSGRLSFRSVRAGVGVEGIESAGIGVIGRGIGGIGGMLSKFSGSVDGWGPGVNGSLPCVDHG